MVFVNESQINFIRYPPATSHFASATIIFRFVEQETSTVTGEANEKVMVKKE
jgi:hypothetical protein